MSAALLLRPLRSVLSLSMSKNHPHSLMCRMAVGRAWCSSKPVDKIPIGELMPSELPEPYFTNDTAVEVKQDISKAVIEVDDVVYLPNINGVPEEHVKSRRVRIFQPAKNAMQSGTDDTHKWALEFETRQRWENPTMGWTSSGDPLSNMRIMFSCREDAARFCDKNGWSYFVEEPRVRKPLRKSYADNFSWDKRTRIGSK